MARMSTSDPLNLNRSSHIVNVYLMASPRSGFAIVTPASRGIGFALARYLLQHTDLPIIATARRNSDNLRHRLLCGMENSAAEQRLSVFDVDVTGSF